MGEMPLWFRKTVKMSRNIYFAGSIRGGRQDVDIYYNIIEQLKTYGSVLTEFVGDKKVEECGTVTKSDKNIHDDDVAMLQQCDALVAEVTQPSLGVGYEIGRAVAMNKHVLCLFRPQNGKILSGMIRGAHNGSTFVVVDYEDVSQVSDILKKYFDSKN